jgi:AcrR family transcriptional regulator
MGIVRKSLKKTGTIEKILIAAEREISVCGFDGATVDNIARQSGVTKQLVYHYFKSKAHLYRAVLERASQESQLLDKIDFYSRLSPEDGIRHFVNDLFDELIKHPSSTTFLLDQALHSGEHITQSSRFIPTTRVYISKIITPILQRGSDAGHFKADQDPDISFWMIFHLVAACFLHQKIMSEVSPQDFSSDAGIDLWRTSTTRFILDSLSG